MVNVVFEGVAALAVDEANESVLVDFAVVYETRQGFIHFGSRHAV